MSTDWNVCCPRCRVYHHLGQRFTSGPTFGYGSNDAEGRKAAADFINDHWDHSGMLTILGTDDIPETYTEVNMENREGGQDE